VAADVYGVEPHTGRGGWTWYTGSAGWMYRLIIESLLGLELSVDKLYFKPCMPEAWQDFTVHYRYRETVYHITVKRAPVQQKATTVTVDGQQAADLAIKLIDDRQDHRAEVLFVGAGQVR
jgi:cellobiose phosphorylase